MVIKRPYKTLRMRGMNPNLCILRMLEDLFSLGVDYMMYVIVFL